jgi:FkbM family methyltransferase
MDLKEYKGHLIREGTMDDYVVREINSYRTLELGPEDIVLDIGANIGTFTCHAARAGVRRVIAVEPDEANYQVLRANVDAMGGSQYDIDTVCGAVVPEGYTLPEVQLYLNAGKNKGMHSTVPVRGRETVNALPVYLKGLYYSAPTKMKIDCEGAEYQFLVVDEIPDSVTGLIIEYNLNHRGEQEKAVAMHAAFIYCGWRCVKQPRFGTKAWATLASYRR